MKMVETTSERAFLFSKEVRRIVFSEVTKKDIPELFNALNQLFSGRRHCKLWVCVGPRDCFFNNEKELGNFLNGFSAGMLLIDDDFFDHFGNARSGHPQV